MKCVGDYSHLVISEAQSLNIFVVWWRQERTLTWHYIHHWPDLLPFLRTISNPF